MKLQEKINQLTGLIYSIGVELEANEENLKKGELFLLIQEIEAALTKPLKFQEKIKKEFLEISESFKMEDNGKTSETHFIEGAEVFYKIANVKPKLDADKVVTEYSRLLADYNQTFDESQFLIEQKPRKTLIIQKKL
jgi:hypothetical protein